jgi:EAL domain-containing protein (putative c-di-GMP-specific phosphodiesterase class I)/signal transduction histidine kinase/CheY-like chemotaxis protein
MFRDLVGMARRKIERREEPAAAAADSAPRARPRRRIAAKLALLIVASMSVAFALLATAAVFTETRRNAELEAERLAGVAKVIASLSSDAVIARDRNGAFKAIRSIGQMRDVEYARIVDARGRLLAETGVGTRLVDDAQLDVSGGRSLSAVEVLKARSLQVSAPVNAAGERVGTVVIFATLTGVRERAMQTLLGSLFAVGLAGGVAMLIAARMGRTITRPIQELAQAMARVQQTHDYSARAEVKSDDEVGDLVAGFNRMLGDIESRDERIAGHVAELETKVAERTADLNVAKDAAEQANAAKSDFLATMSHEIRTPLNGILAMADMLFAGELPKRQKRYAEVIAKSGRSLLAIINDVLDFSKIEAGKLELEAETIDLAEAADDVASLFHEKARSKGLELSAWVDPTLPPVLGDEVRLRQVIGNLVNNAVKFTEKGGVLIDVRREPTAPGRLVRIAVRDTGVGIPKHKLPTLFDAFTQADQSTTRRFGGTGLGLAICKRLVAAMGGEWRLNSAEGKGSTFAFVMPIREAGAAPTWPLAEAAAKPVARLAGFGAITRSALGRYLEAAGFEVLAERGSCALLIATPAEAAEHRRGAEAVVCLADPGDDAAVSLQDRGQADLVLPAPPRQSDLRAILSALVDGRALADLELTTATAQRLPRFEGRLILVADDSDVNREVANEALTQLGAHVAFVENGQEAVEAVAARTFDLVLMDGSMPVMDGFEASRAIRAAEAGSERRTPILALTANVLGAGAEAWRDAGMDGVVHKPYTLAALAQGMAEVLQPSGYGAPQSPPATADIPPSADGDGLFDASVTAELQAMAAAGRSDFVEKVRGLYRRNAPGRLADLLAAKGAGDAEQAASAAHALKSMSLNLGAIGVSRRCSEIEGAAREGQVPSDAVLRDLAMTLAQTLERLGQAPEAGAPAVPSSATPKPDPDMALAQDLLRALATDEISVAYQPQVDRSGERMLGVEALVRWRHPEHGPISPDRFIPAAERAGVIDRLTDHVLARGIAEMALVQGLVLAVNVSASEFIRPEFPDRIFAVLDRTGFPPRRLELEVTETAMLEDEGQAHANMLLLKERGVQIALDDFGAGFSSLRHLHSLPYDTLKIDKVFIDDCLTNSQAAAIVHSVISIGRALGMKVLAEGVETEAQANFLKVAGVHAMQGYHFGRPGALADLAPASQAA